MTEEQLGEIIARGILSETKPLSARITALEGKVAELEARPAGIVYEGTWTEERAYDKGVMVTRDGSVWHSNVSGNRSTPGQHPHWTLAVKRGKDAR